MIVINLTITIDGEKVSITPAPHNMVKEVKEESSSALVTPDIRWNNFCKNPLWNTRLKNSYESRKKMGMIKNKFALRTYISNFGMKRTVECYCENPGIGIRGAQFIIAACT